MRRRGLFTRGPELEADVRPTLLGVVTLMFLLLFFLLTTSSGQRLGVLDLRLGSPSDLAPLPHAGLVKDVLVTLRDHDLTLVYTVQSTDISTSSTSVEQRTRSLPAQSESIQGERPDFAGLLAALSEVHAIDPSQERARFEPDDVATAETVIAVMDVIHGPIDAPLFPKIALSGSTG
ncbi:MAG: hypothetical protein Q8P18_14645 [Pseudomonadota bacterium]|nr:hypothetical protein [Pseudomonadota bacterium]